MSIPVGRSASSVDRWVARIPLPTITTNRCIFLSLSIKNPFQDVCEFTHKLLDWLEEAFKIRDVSQKGDVPMKEDPAHKDNAKAEEEPMEAENLEKADAEKESPASVGRMEEGHRNAGEKNPMYSLFYGQVGSHSLFINYTIARRI